MLILSVSDSGLKLLYIIAKRNGVVKPVPLLKTFVKKSAPECACGETFWREQGGEMREEGGGR
jgi:hypothetical protein